ncbi:MAG: HNH endonuclease signature motif containing protein [Phycisphaerales bacterium]
MWGEQTATDWFVNGNNVFVQGAGLLLGIIGSGAEGFVDGLAMAADKATFEKFDRLHNHVEKLKCDNGWEYQYASYSLTIAREAAIAALTGGGSMAAQLIGKGLAIYQVAHGSYNVGQGIWYISQGETEYGTDLVISGGLEAAGGFLIGFTSSRPAGGLTREAEEAIGRVRPPPIKSWNEFQRATRGQFGSRAEAGAAWRAYREANGLANKAVSRSSSARRNYLKSLADHPNTPAWQRQWLRQGKSPPGYEVDHIRPLSIGGPDTPANMRLQLKSLHDLHHSKGLYRPWERY